MTIAQTAQGAVQGREKDSVLLFAGIPYAAPPIDNLRFRAAQPHESWSSVRPALKFGPAAPQIASGGTDSAVDNLDVRSGIRAQTGEPPSLRSSAPVREWPLARRACPGTRSAGGPD